VVIKHTNRSKTKKRIFHPKNHSISCNNSFTLKKNSIQHRFPWATPCLPRRKAAISGHMTLLIYFQVVDRCFYLLFLFYLERSLNSLFYYIYHVRKVGERFEFSTKQFIQLHVPKMKYCMPERTWEALSNGIFRFPRSIIHVRV